MNNTRRELAPHSEKKADLEVCPTSATAAQSGGVILRALNLVKHFPVRGGIFARQLAEVRAVEDVSFEVRRGETLGVVGESGCGKSTLGRLLLRLEEPTRGSVFFEGRDILACTPRDLFLLRRDLQMIFQDPYSSLNPRMTAGEIVREPLVIHKIGGRAQQLEQTAALLEQVGLSREMIDRYPHEFSGGQRQRIGIARALALNPKIIVADEPVSALDVSVRAQALNLMAELQRRLGLTYVFISHDMSVVEYMSDAVAVMYLGRLVEIGPKRAVFDHPAHPYTRALIDAAPLANPKRRRERAPLRGETPSALNPPTGCAFHPRCPLAVASCREAIPPLEPVGANSVKAPDITDTASEHRAACFRKNEFAG